MGFAGPGVLEELRSPGSCDQRVWDLHGGVKGPIHEVGALGQGKVTALPPGGVGNEEGTLIVDGTRISEKPIERSLQTRIRQSQNINGCSNVGGGGGFSHMHSPSRDRNLWHHSSGKHSCYFHSPK